MSFSIEQQKLSDIYLIGAVLFEPADSQNNIKTLVAKKYFTPYNLEYTVQEGSSSFTQGKVLLDISEWANLLSPTLKIGFLVVMNSLASEGALKSLSLEKYDDFRNDPVQVVQTETALPLISKSGIAAFISLSGMQFSTSKSKNYKALKTQEATIATRPFSTMEFESLKLLVGTREPGKSYNQIIHGFGTGLAPPSADQWESLRKTMRTVDYIELPKSKALLGQGVDLSKDKAFPPIGNQARLGSCVAFSTAYYCRTFQEAKEHGWDLSISSWSNGQPSDSRDRIMSPAFLYNIINGGKDNGSSYLEAHKTLGEIGCASWETMPYDGYNTDSYAFWPEESAWREAPLYRSSFDQSSGGYLCALIVDTDLELEILCQLLDSGIPMSISVDANLYDGLTADDEWNEDNYIDPQTNHANTIVGYEL